MPWRNRYIATRRHPLALSCYAMCGLIGAFFLLDLFGTTSTSQTTTSGWQLAWEWELLLGGAGGFTGAVWPTARHLDDALSGESAAALLAGFGFLSWALSSGVQSDWQSPGYLVFAVLAAGFITRSWQARRDRRKWRDLARRLAEESGSR